MKEFKEFELFRNEEPAHVRLSTVDFGKSMGLEVSGEDIEQLVDENSERLTEKLCIKGK